jgi:type I site-specific restriction endonuclease
MRNFFENLYAHQQQVLGITKTADKGIICLPTGTGKTYCEAAIVLDEICQKGKGVYLVVAPRIFLTYQLFKEFYKCALSLGKDVRYGFIHSGGGVSEEFTESERIMANMNNDTDIEYSQIPTFLSKTDIKNYVEECTQVQGLPVILFSTYHSAGRASDIYFDVIINDEAHYLSQIEFHELVSTLQSKRKYFFTATKSVSSQDDERGMNNVEKYGPELYYMSPRTAIEQGFMVRPRMHFIKPDYNEKYTYEDFKNSTGRIIYKAFSHHSRYINLKPKMLVSTRGSDDMKNFLNSPYHQKLRDKGVDIFIVSSHTDLGNIINGEGVTREVFLTTLKKYGDNPKKKILVLHYNILTEGIDISGFTAILPLRIIGKTKFMQTYGRAARLTHNDKKLINEKIISPNDLLRMEKPYSYVIVPNIIKDDNEFNNHFMNMVEEFRQYEFSPSELILITDESEGVYEEIPLEEITEDETVSTFRDQIKAVISQLEDKKIASMAPVDFLLNFLQ